MFLILTKLNQALRRRLKFELKEYDMFCLHQQLFEEMNIYTDFYVIKGQKREVLFTMTNPLDEFLYNQVVTDGRFQFRIDTSGTYTFCFDNSNSGDSSSYAKQINFYLSTNDNFQDPELASESDATNEHQRSDEMENALEETVKSSFDKLDNNIGEIYYLQDSFQNHAKYDMYVLELILERVNFWSTFNMIIIILSCFFQVYFIRHLFGSNKFKYHQNVSRTNVEPRIIPNEASSSFVSYMN